MKRTVFLAVALLLTVAAVSDVSAEMRTPAMSISGVVMTENGKPLPKAMVEFKLMSVNGKEFAVSTRTNENGKYVISGLPMSKGMGKASFEERGAVIQPVAVVNYMNEVNFIL